MAQRTPAAGFEPGMASLLAQLDDVCALLRDASGEPFRLVTDIERTSGGLTELAPGWALAGGEDASRREAAAELLGHVLSAERDIESLCTEILDRYEEVTLTQRLGLQMARTMDQEGLAQTVIREITDWLHARAGEIWLRDGESTRLAGALLGHRTNAIPLGELGPLQALNEGCCWSQDVGGPAEAVVAVPLPGDNGETIGVLVMRGKDGNRSFEQREIRMLTAVAALIAGFLRSHRLARQGWLEEHERSTSDVARLLQPRREVICQGLELSSACRNGQEPGSDVHDIVRTPDGGIALSLARVSTGGTRAAIHMALAKGVMQAEARAGSSPGKILRRMNEVVSPELIRSDLFATAYVVRFHPGARRLDAASAGHAVPLLIRAGSRLQEIDLAGPALGLLSATEPKETSRALEQDDLLVFYSDGFVDARNPDANGLDLGYLGELVSTAENVTAEGIRDRLLGAFDSHREGLAARFDASLIVARIV